ncbi:MULTISPECIES: effector-associated domain 2-containing protein [Thermomonospora]|uniref:Effector-associated domain-containing protein n=1 Tax=Thermomonospora curvata (strain ATCC 19995 / DSM 43183 / JCM 3096 / KCTC 9072 / NBRC 15933 / NCIMB 10081 / Henssen B9) TaxID=471852 RepID=D1A3G4_THECD|nr:MULTISPECIES: hypothetical protein [Thermomonospora]ACY96089.1 hypothetical protein Tcur_0492 [Thermomonospora curvata DSM 43183]PKK15947.1 MAG: hypothetical protein BUE48_002395 [Thermomonospora sp. CIF 1]
MGSFGGRDGWRPAGNCSLFACDIVGFSDPLRSDRAREHLHQKLYSILESAFAESGLPPESCYQEDRGDGALVLLPPELDPSLLVHPLIGLLRGKVLDHNELSADVAQIRLRVALHIGRAKANAKGIVGSDVNHLRRLLDAPPFKEEMAESGAVLGVLVSQEMYDAVIRDARGLIDPEEFRPVEVHVKTTHATGWLRIPGDRRGLGGVRAGGGPSPPSPNGSSQELVQAGRRPSQEPRAEVHIPGPNGEPALRPEVAGQFELVNRILAIPHMRTSEGRDDVVDSLRQDIRIRIARRSRPQTDWLSIVRTCAEYPDGLEELIGLIHEYTGDTAQMMALRELVARMGWTN